MPPSEIVSAIKMAGAIPDDIASLITASMATSESGEPYDLNAGLRFQTERELYRSLKPADRPFVHFLLAQEVTAHRYAWGVGNSLVLCVGMLFELGQPEDAILIWQAKKLTFDTHCGISMDFLIGAGLDQTIDYWRKQSSSEGKEFDKFLTEAAYNGEFGDPEEFRSDIKAALEQIAYD